MQIAEQVGSTFANITDAEKHWSKYHVSVPVSIKYVLDHSSFAPIELGTAFEGRRNASGCYGHKAAQCPNVRVKPPASYTTANHRSQTSTGKGKQNVGSNNLKAALGWL